MSGIVVKLYLSVLIKETTFNFFNISLFIYEVL